MREEGYRRKGGLPRVTVSGQAQEMLVAKGLLHVLERPVDVGLDIRGGRTASVRVEAYAYAVGRQMVERLLDMRYHERKEKKLASGAVKWTLSALRQSQAQRRRLSGR